MIETAERTIIKGPYNHHIYEFPEEINEINFFTFEKKLILEKQWAALPPAAKSIFPVICSHCNAEGSCYPSEQTIAILSGCTAKTVQTGLKGLRSMEKVFHIKKKLTNIGHHRNTYQIDFPEQKKGIMFPFHKSIIESGNWSLLTRSAKALYPVMRAFSFWEDNLTDQFDIDDYKEREYDFVNAERDVLNDHAGIHGSTFYKALHSLQENYFIEDIGINGGYKTWKVFLRPKRGYEAEYMNKLVLKRYCH